MIFIHNKSSRQIPEMAIAKSDDEETQVSVEEEKHLSLRLTEATGTKIASSDFPLFDSFGSGSMGASMTQNNDIAEKPNESDFEMAVDFDSSFKGGMMPARRMSEQSLDISSRYGDEDVAVNSSKNRVTTTARGQFFLRWLLFSLLIFGVILSAFATGNHYTRTCAFANLMVAGAAIIVFVVYDSRMRRQQASLTKSVSRTETIVNSLFPEIVRDRILEEGDFASTKFAPTSSRTSSEEIAPYSDEDLADTTATANKIIREDTKSTNNSSYNSVSSQLSDDSIEKNSREKSIPPPPAPRSSYALSSPTLTRRKSNQSSSNLSRRKSNQSADSDANIYASDAISDSNHFRSTLASNSSHSSPHSSKPIADYFPSASIMFADMVGFTSWASIREPAQGTNRTEMTGLCHDTSRVVQLESN